MTRQICQIPALLLLAVCAASVRSESIEVVDESVEIEPAGVEPRGVEPRHVESPPDIAGRWPMGRVPRNIILLIGDGMGPQQFGLLSLYARHAQGSTVPDRTPAIEKVINSGALGLMRTEPHGVLVPDSAASATQMATGQSAGSEMIGANYHGDPVPTIVEIAAKLGKSTGLVSDTRMTHGTPAAFAAHQRHRSMENEIAVDLLNNRVDVLLSGGLRHWVPAAINDRDSAAYDALRQTTGAVFPVTSKRNDNRNLLLEARRDYTLAFDRGGLEAVKSGRVLGLFADSEMLDALSARAAESSGIRREPSLVEMTNKAIELLDQNSQGFFLMVEGGQIDWAGHNNDVGALLHELLRFDRAVRAAYQFAAGRDDTLVLVTADHETGAFGFSYSGRPLPRPRRIDGSMFKNADHQPDFNFAPARVLDKIHAQQKSFYAIFGEFDALPAEQRTAERLVELINANVAFKITLDDALRILRRTRNPNFAEGHRFLGNPTAPKIHDFNAFYVYGENLRYNLLGRALAEQQHVAWGAGTHTSTPVVLGAYGPGCQRFTGVLHTTDMGKRMIELVQGEGEIVTKAKLKH